MSETGLRILVIGDPHFRQRWIATVDEFTRQVLELVSNPETKPDLCVILGDVLHDHEQSRVTCQHRAIAWFKEMAKHVYTLVLIGNHDLPNNNHFLTGMHFFSGLEGVKNLRIVDKSAVSTEVEKDGHSYRFVSVPYVPNGRFQEALQTLKTTIETSRPAAIFAHQEFKGCKMGAIPSENGDVLPLDFPLVISGHIHEYQMPQENLIYVGTPYQTSYAEDRNKGVYFFTFNKNKVPTIKRVSLKLRVKESITLTPQQFAKFELPDAAIDLRIVITGPQAEVDACKQTETYKRAIKLPYIKIMLEPKLDLKSLEQFSLAHVSYTKSLYDSVKENPKLLETFHEIIGIA